MSAWVTPAIAKAGGPEIRAGPWVRSGICEIRLWSSASPIPSTRIGWDLRSRARSALVSTTPPPASVTRQQSSRLNGQQIIRELSTSSTVIGSRYIAFGLRPAHLLVATAISASWSFVVPYWAMWRDAASAYEPTGLGRPYGSSNWPTIVWRLDARGAI